MEKKISLTDLREARITELEKELRKLRREKETKEVISEDVLKEEAEGLLEMLADMTKKERHELIGKAKIRLEASRNFLFWESQRQAQSK